MELDWSITAIFEEIFPVSQQLHFSFFESSLFVIFAIIYNA